MIKVKDLKHGYIYLLSTGENARCNICSQGTEVWFTDKQGKLLGGKPTKLLSENDKGFKNNDIK